MRYLSFITSFVLRASIFSLCLFLPAHVVAKEPYVVVNNRVLAQVNGKAITVRDLTKKMDMIMLRQYPEQFASSQIRYEFYQANWQKVLSDLVNRELVQLAADELNWPVPQGDIRQEMEEIFGPNVRLNLENANLTYDEVWQMLRADITIRRMLSLQVNSRVFSEITPERIKKAYEAYVKDGGDRSEYCYRMITLKAKSKQKAMEAAVFAHKLLQEKKASLETLQEILKKEKYLSDEVTLAISSSLQQKQEMLAEQVKSVVSKLAEGGLSEPQEQISRLDGVPVVRLYLLEKKSEATPKSFVELEAVIRENLIRERVEEETEKYFANLRKHYDVRLEDVQKEFPQGFTPFALRKDSIESKSYQDIASIPQVK